MSGARKSIAGAPAFPDFVEVRQRPAARIFPWGDARAVEGRVDEHRERVLRLARARDGVDVPGVVPGLESLLGRRALAENLLPGAACFHGARGVRAQEVGRNRGLQRRLRGRAAIGGLADGPDLVLDLNHDDGLLTRIHAAQVAQQRREGPGVGVAAGVRESRERLDAGAGGRLGARKAFLIALDPVGRVARHPVLPAPEPEQHDVQPGPARLSDDVADQRKVALPSCGSTSSQETGTSTVLRPSPVNLRSAAFATARLVALELASSPPRTKNG